MLSITRADTDLQVVNPFSADFTVTGESLVGGGLRGRVAGGRDAGRCPVSRA